MAIKSDRAYRQEYMAILQACSDFGFSDTEDVPLSAIVRAGFQTLSAASPRQGEARDEPCASGHVWSNQYGDDWKPEDGMRCDCHAKTWGQWLREVRHHTPEFDNHHNAAMCPYCNPDGLKFTAPVRQGEAAPHERIWWKCNECDEPVFVALGAEMFDCTTCGNDSFTKIDVPVLLETAWKLANKIELMEMEPQPLASGEAASAERLRELAQAEARRSHEHALYAASNGHPDEGHVLAQTDYWGFAECPHPDCVLVRGAAPAEKGQP